MTELEKKNRAEKAIQTLCKTAIVTIVTMDEVEEGLPPQLEYTAKAIQQEYRLKDAVMDEYHAEIAKAIESTWADGIAYRDAEDARDVIYEMCDRLSDCCEVMQHVRNASEMLYIWMPVPDMIQHS